MTLLRRELRDTTDSTREEAEDLIRGLLHVLLRGRIPRVKAPLGHALNHLRRLGTQARPVETAWEGVIESRTVDRESTIDEVAQ